MNGTKITRRRVAALSGLVIPVVVLGLLRIGSRGPASATALVAAPGAEQPAAERVRPDPRVVSAVAYLRARAPETAVQSPFDHPAPPPAAEAPAADPAPARPAGKPARRHTVPEFRVTSIMGRGESAFASINGRVCRVGAEVEGWRVVAIDPTTRLVELEGPDGTRTTASPDERGSK